MITTMQTRQQLCHTASATWDRQQLMHTLLVMHTLPVMHTTGDINSLPDNEKA